MQKLEFHSRRHIMKMNEQSMPGTIVCDAFVPKVLYTRLLSHPIYTSVFQLMVYCPHVSLRNTVLVFCYFFTEDSEILSQRVFSSVCVWQYYHIHSESNSAYKILILISRYSQDLAQPFNFDKIVILPNLIPQRFYQVHKSKQRGGYGLQFRSVFETVRTTIE